MYLAFCLPLKPCHTLFSSCTDICACLFVDSVSLPYDHTYQHIFQYGVYTKLRSPLLPLSVAWHNVPGGIDTLWVRGH